MEDNELLNKLGFTKVSDLLNASALLAEYVQPYVKKIARYEQMIEEMTNDMNSANNVILYDYLKNLLKKYGDVS